MGDDPVHLSPEEAGWEYCGLSVIALAPGENRTVLLAGEEAAVVPLSGSVRVDSTSASFVLKGRAGVFAGDTDLCYLPPNTSFSLSCLTGGEVAVATAVTEAVTEAHYYRAGHQPAEVRGAGAATRTVRQLLGIGASGPNRLIVVEVVTPDGNWSSHPPHKHDEEGEEECPLEEIYYFRFDQPGAFGLHRTYTKDGAIDETVTVRDGDVFLVPRGYHGPCGAVPGYPMYYMNVMAGPGPRRWLFSTDPDHAWLWQEFAAWPRGERA